jgi:hypothetical protein
MVSPVLSAVTVRQTSRTAVGQDLLRAAAQLIAFSGGAAAGGFVILVALFKAGVFGHIDILFYRGVALCLVSAIVLAGMVTTLGRWWPSVTLRDTFATACLSFGLNLSFLVIAPVTVDRSISVFIIATMSAAPEQTVSTAEIDQAFRAQYLDRMAQIDRRMKEQVISGTIVEDAGRYRITPKGLGFMQTARWVAWMFDTDTKLLTQPPVSQGSK